MREALFIKKNVDKWNKYQHEQTNDPDETAERFVTLVDDLAYAKTFYPKSRAAIWLNSLAAGLYQNLYKNKKEKYSRFFDFWKYELPLLFRQYRWILLFATILFSLIVAIGFFSSRNDPQFVRNILGDEYVNQTEERIANGDPFGVYRDDNKFTMFVRIAYNNIKVAFLTFISGLSLGYFTLKLLWQNGLMVGSFHEMFFAKGMGINSILVIWIHGTIEILSIVIAATAAFILAGGILFPGSYRRIDSFKIAAKNSAKLMVALVPFFIVAAFIESYITYLMSNSFDNKDNFGLPIWLSLLILALSLFLMIWYFVYRPYILHKKGYVLQEKSILNKLNDD